VTTDVDEQQEGDRSLFGRGVLIGLLGGVVAALLLISVGGTVVSLVDDVFGSNAPAQEAEPVEPATGDATLIATGEELTTSTGCVACHTTDGSVLVGPSWAGLSDRADEDYIRQSILDPGAVIVEGFDDLMPKTYADILSPDDLDALVAYLMSLP
jgi:mono/diheme cytochrome c family protein